MAGRVGGSALLISGNYDCYMIAAVLQSVLGIDSDIKLLRGSAHGLADLSERAPRCKRRPLRQNCIKMYQA